MPLLPSQIGLSEPTVVVGSLITFYETNGMRRALKDFSRKVSTRQIGLLLKIERLEKGNGKTVFLVYNFRMAGINRVFEIFPLDLSKPYFYG
jgi:hypothetical protein